MAVIKSIIFNSTNLVNPSKPVEPQLKQLQSSTFFERPGINMPKPFEPLSKQQRPGLYFKN